MRVGAGRALLCVLMLAAMSGTGLAAGGPHLDAEPPNPAAAPAESTSSGNSGNEWRVDTQAFGAGAGHASAGIFEVTAIAGQPDAGALVPATSARFAIASGFWSVVATPTPRPDLLLADGFEQ